MSQSTNNVFFNAKPQSFYGKYNNINFIVNQILSKIQTVTLVKIVSCTNEGGIAPVGFVDVMPLVNQIDGNGNNYQHGTIFNVPYCRIQGGTNAIIIDPVVGDIGMCGFANRDISTVKVSKKNSPPASMRKFSYSDALYFGGCLNGTPENYIQFQGNTISLKANSIIINGNVSLNGSLDVTNDVTANGTSLHTHVHSGVQTGTDNTGQPV